MTTKSKIYFKSNHRSIGLFVALLTTSSIISSCASYSFIKTGQDQNYPSKPTDCTIQLVTELPSVKLVEIGVCTGESFNELKNRTEDATEKLKECGCINGGDLILLGAPTQTAIERKGSSVFVSGKVFRFNK